jgi:hypothetical protein
MWNKTDSMRKREKKIQVLRRVNALLKLVAFAGVRRVICERSLHNELTSKVLHFTIFHIFFNNNIPNKMLTISLFVYYLDRNRFRHLIGQLIPVIKLI